MKKNLKYISDLVDKNMITEDSIGNVETEFKYESGFTNQEQINEKRKMSAVASALSKEISFARESIRQQEIICKYGVDVAESGKEWEETPYWSSLHGDILISNLGDDHLCRIPRHLYNNGVVRSAKDLPPKIVAEIKKRGFKLLNNCIVIQE